MPSIAQIRLEARFAKLEEQLRELASELERTKAKLAEREYSPVVMPLSTLDPEPFEILKPINALIQESEGGYIATYLEANLGASGETRTEAIDGLKDRIVTTFERLAGKTDDKLGPGPLRQKQVLTSLIRRR